ncbi:DUF2975 domain-containing protein [Flavobacterium hauense]
MKRLSILKSFIDILRVLLIAAIVIGMPFCFMLLFAPHIMSREFMDVKASDIPKAEVILITIMIGSLYFGIYALRLLSNTLVYFRDGYFFETEVGINFNKIGKAIVAGYLISSLPWMVYQIFVTPVIELADPSDWLIDTLSTLALGLFFLVLSEVFQAAKRMKEENDLTV